MSNPKDLPRDIGGFIRDLRRNAKISLRQLAEQAGVSNPYLSQIERGLRKPSAEVLQQLASALRVSTPAMYLRAGLLDDREGQGVLAAIAADPDLTMPQKQSLSQIYETFRRENLRHAEPEDTRPGHAWPEDTRPETVPPGAVPTGAERESPTDAVLESVAVTETGAAAPPVTSDPAAPPHVRETGTEAVSASPTTTAAPLKKIAKKAVKKAAPPAPPVASAPDEEK
ncbi:helix-turn-helix domain-containing protein [Plantactinospora sp. B5E13]|uniref:helix-turn-helix domain-containing protein n=1 Tax=Plantactinospora sp. B5E13 TaxID=3153758 RepID=UPI00325E131D